MADKKTAEAAAPLTTIRAYAAEQKLYPQALLPHIPSAGGDIDAFVSPADIAKAVAAMKERI